MANKNFSRGTEVYGASASMVFVGNTDHSVSYMLKHSDLFDALPKDYYDSAFLDRVHAYIPGWEVQKLRNEMFTSNYGFIVDYLAEVLRDLRKEDRTQEYNNYFELSNSITTRDKTSISKTFAGMAKIIYPDGEMKEEDAKELLDLAIESRKRVKQQLQKMDETFEEVDFSYKLRSSGKRIEVETLEELEFGTPKITEKKLDSEEEVNVPADSNEVSGLRLEAKQKVIRDNQSGISYDNLFGAYLIGATEVKLVDPYIRQPYQLRNFMEFVKLLVDQKNPDTELKLHLVTTCDEEYQETTREAFDTMAYSVESLGIILSYEFDDFIHDRFIQLDNGWKIVLGRGLDIWQKTGGWYDINEYVQEKRICKSCEVTFLRQ
jgi:ATP-dependent Lon protease